MQIRSRLEKSVAKLSSHTSLFMLFYDSIAFEDQTTYSIHRRHYPSLPSCRDLLIWNSEWCIFGRCFSWWCWSVSSTVCSSCPSCSAGSDHHRTRPRSFVPARPRPVSVTSRRTLTDGPTRCQRKKAANHLSPHLTLMTSPDHLALMTPIVV